MLKKIIIYWFSGTGNSLIIAKSFAEELNNSSIATELRSLPCSPPKEDEFLDETAFAVVFPVYEQGTPLFIYEWLETWPENKIKTPIIIISTMAMCSGLVKVPLQKLFSEKGFNPLAVKEIIMPCNLTVTLPKFLNNWIISKGKKTAAKFAKKIIENKASWPWRPKFLKMNKAMVKKFENFISKRFYADKNCVNCGLCIKMCPLENISQTEDGLKWDINCTVCLRCINFCPKKAIQNSLKPFFLIRYKAPDIKCSDLMK